MTDSHHQKIAIIDIGSNAVKLVVFEPPSPTPLLKIREMTGLGRNLTLTKMLDPEGKDQTIEILRNLIIAAKEQGAERLEIFATAAMRDASDGPDFIEEIQKRYSLTVRILTQEDEAYYLGVALCHSFKKANGLGIDLGGRSCECIDLVPGKKPRFIQSLLLGPLCFTPQNPAVFEEMADFLKKTFDYKLYDDLYLSGGGLRHLGRLYLKEKDKRDDSLHGLTIQAGKMLAFCRDLARQDIKVLQDQYDLSGRRLDQLPHYITVMKALIDAFEPKRIIFSAYGVREGLFYELSPSF